MPSSSDDAQLETTHDTPLAAIMWALEDKLSSGTPSMSLSEIARAVEFCLEPHLTGARDERRAWTARIGELERALAGAARRASHLCQALEEIVDRHIGDCPVALAHLTDEEWARRCHNGLRTIARHALRDYTALAPAHSPESAEGA